MDDKNKPLLERLGFRFGKNGAHAARTMMLEDIACLCNHLSADAEQGAFAREVIELNVLGKPTKKARELALRHLTALYALDPGVPPYRAFRRLWASDATARPVLALQIAIARDPLLRGTQDFMLAKKPGELVSREEIERLLELNYPERFSPASLQSFAQNVNGTWTQAGYLVGKSKKIRSIPHITPANVAFALFLGYLHAFTGQQLFSTQWVALLGLPMHELEKHATAASQRGLLVFLNSGGIKEVRFPDTLSTEEELLRREVSNV